MCGISGIVTHNRKVVLKDRLLAMNKALIHRGPDDGNVYVSPDNRVGLAHRRLSIIDLSAKARQPMFSEDGHICLIFNGEIYNFMDIKKYLIRLGYKFTSNSDTEVVLKAYQQWGENCLDKFNGMFAFAIYDKSRKTVLLARDYFGMKPLYYYLDKEKLIFASEIKAIKRGTKFSENPDWKVCFLLLGYIPEPITVLNNVFMLDKGTCLRIHLDSWQCSIFKYCEFKFTNKVKNEFEAISNIKALINNSVKRHLISDAPIGVFLSGGLDSSIIALLSSRYLGNKLKTLSVIFHESKYSEYEYQKKIVNKIKSCHKTYLVSKEEFFEDFQNIIKKMDQPSIDGINTYFISKYAKKEGLKTVLSGLGADEIFGGYPSFTKIYKLWWLRNFNLKVFKLFGNFGNERIKKLSFLSLRNEKKYYFLFRGLFTIKSISQILGIKERDVLNKVFNIVNLDCQKMELGNYISHLETDFYMKNQLLRDSDYMGMQNSIEIRLPFLDKELVKYLYSIDPCIKFRKHNKYLLKKAFFDVLPCGIVGRKKMGFTFPINLWLNDNFFKSYIKNSGSLSNHKKLANHTDGFRKLALIMIENAY